MTYQQENIQFISIPIGKPGITIPTGKYTVHLNNNRKIKSASQYQQENKLCITIPIGK